jgi:hypothetical protein
VDVKQRDLSLSDNSRIDAAFWLTPVKAHMDKTPKEVIHALVVDRQVYAFREETQARKSTKPGDWICFYASGGIVADARVASCVQNIVLGGVPREYSWAFRLDKIQSYTDDPTHLDLALRQQLDAFRGKDLAKRWGWFVQTTRKITEHDFDLLTRRKARQLN